MTMYGGQADLITMLTKDIFSSNVEKGWYTDINTGQRIERNIPELLCLIHSEISEGLEGYRKDLMDDHLPHRKMLEVELADAFIRICDLAGYQNFDLGRAVFEKLQYNANRTDHSLEARKSGGKKF